MEDKQLEWRFVAKVDRKGELTIEQDSDQYFTPISESSNIVAPFSLGLFLGLFVALIVVWAICKVQN